MPHYGTLTDSDGIEIDFEAGSGIGNENFTFEHYTIPTGTNAGESVTLGLRFSTWYGDGEPTTFNETTGVYTAVAGEYSGSSSLAAAAAPDGGNWNFMWSVYAPNLITSDRPFALKGMLKITGPNDHTWGNTSLAPSYALPITPVGSDPLEYGNLEAQDAWTPGFSFLQEESPLNLWSGLNYDFDDVGTYTFEFRLLDEDEVLNQTLSISVNVVAPAVTATACFTEDAIVKTDQGLQKIKDITNKHTIDNKLIKGISKTTYPQNKIVTIEKNALGKNIPNKKTIVAPFHRFLIDGSLKAAVELVNKDSVYLTKYTQQTLYNIILEETGTMDVNNITVETLDPSTLVAKLFDGSLDEKQRRKIVKSFNSYHKNLKNKPNKTIKDYIV